MKLRWLSLLLAAFLLAAPTLSADDASADLSLGELIEQIVSLILGEEVGLSLPPSGDQLEGGPNYPPSGAVLNVDQPELGTFYPPGG